MLRTLTRELSSYLNKGCPIAVGSSRGATKSRKMYDYHLRAYLAPALIVESPYQKPSFIPFLCLEQNSLAFCVVELTYVLRDLFMTCGSRKQATLLWLARLSSL